MIPFILVGAITWYAGPYVNQPLRCGGIYDTTHEWIALDLDALGGSWQCGDLIELEVDGEYFYYRIKDTGPLSKYYIQEGRRYTPIIADLPKHCFPWEGLSVEGQVMNITQMVREWEQ